ncbi:hypothetical protein PC123_g7755 [Phytophthora cactorum]|nr:hypothetical protein PC123_g7755 [Phytophthora cactorum]
MTLGRRTNYDIKASRAGNGAGGAVSSQFASVQERRAMKKVAQPEHAYTGCVPYTPTDDDSDAVPKKRNPPILGYRGHLRNDEDRIGTTFTHGLAVASRPVLPRSGAKARPPNQPRQVHFADDTAHQTKPSGVNMSSRSGYGQFANASGYGAFAAPPPKANMSPRSGYGAFDNASGYGAFAAPPAQKPGAISPRSGYGAFDNASGYGAFAAPPGRGGMSPRSGYGAFDNASGYGTFAAPPGGMSPRSYGAFENASGCGAFATPPAQKGMSPRSGYGEFDNASGYGAFAAPPRGEMSPRSGYGRFDDASGYGNFASPPDPMHGNSTPDHDSIPRYKPTQGQSDQRDVRVHPSNNQVQELREQHRDTNRASRASTPSDAVLYAKYQHAINRVGGEQAALRLWHSAGQTIWQRYMTRTELLQAVRRSFEKHEGTNRGIMTKSQLKEALRDLGCVFTDDQITALFGMYDQRCSGTVPMSELLLALTEKL